MSKHGPKPLGRVETPGGVLLTVREAARRRGWSVRTTWRRVAGRPDLVRQDIPGATVVLIPEAVVDALPEAVAVGRRAVAYGQPDLTAPRARRTLRARGAAAR